MTTAKQLHLRLFLEGEEVPVVSAQVSIGVNAPSSASIQIIPIDEGVDFKPRTMVHLFIYDDEATVSSSYVSKGTYRLLFAGEVIGFSVVRNPQNRALVLQCVDFISYWMTAHATAIEYGGTDSNAMVDHSEVFASDPTLFDDLVSQTSQKILEWVAQTPKTPGLDTIKGLAGGIIRIMEIVGGVIQETGKRTTGVNDFFTVAELRARILQQVCAEENDKSASQLFDNEFFAEWISSGVQNIGRQITLNDVILLLLKYIYYEYIPNPAAKYDPFVKYDQRESNAKSTLKSTSYGGKAYTFLEQAQKGFTEAVQLTTVPPNPGLDQAVALLELTVTTLAPKNATSGSTSPGPAQAVANERQKNSNNARLKVKGTLTYLDDAKKALETQKKGDPSLAPLIDEIIGKISSATTIAMAYDSPTITANEMAEAAALVTDAMAMLGANGITTKATTFVGGTVQRLKSILFRPDCWFAAPPRCNVLFPEQYSSVSFDRNWMSEVTRLEAGTANDLAGPDPSHILNHYKMAPRADFILDSDKTDDTRSYRFLMSHELHTGIIPRTMWVPEAVNVKELNENDWLQNAADFHYFSSRFASRGVAVSARLNPGLVCGFPAAIIMTPLILPPKLRGKNVTVDTLMSSTNVPYQLVGMISSLTHNVDQNGGSTSISMTHVRRHRGLDDEVLNLKYQENAKVDRIIWYTITKKDAKNEPLTKTVWDTGASWQKTFIPGPDIAGKKKEILWGATPQGDPSGIDITTVNYAPIESTFPAPVGQTDFTSPTFGDVTQVVVDPYSKTFIKVSPQLTTGRTKEKSKKKSKEISFTKKGDISGVPDAVGVQIPDGPIGLVFGTTEGLFNGKIVGVEVTNSKRTKLGDKYVFEAIRVYEKISVTLAHTPPLEEIVRPKWFSDGYMNENISNRIYLPFLGCRSIVDEIQVSMTGKGSKATYPGNNRSGVQVDSNKSQQAAIATVQKVEGDRAKNSVDRALTWWSYIYGEVKGVTNTARDVEKFIRDFTTRPIATIDEVLGSSDLRYSVKVNVGEDYKVSGTEVKATRGKEGFHSRAIARDLVDSSRTNRLVGLLDNPDGHYPRLDDGGPESAIPKRYDVRYEKKQAVLTYKRVLEVEKGRGIRG